MSLVAGLLAASAVLLALRPRRRAHRPDTNGVPAARTVRHEHSLLGPDAVADWAAALSREVRAGATLRAALAGTVPAHPGLAASTEGVRREMSHGAALPSALDRLPAENPHVGLVRSVVEACAILGGTAAEPLDRVAATLRGRAADLEERAAQSAQAHLSARVMTLLPLAALGFLASSDEGVRAIVTAPAGLSCLLAGGAFNVLGWWWMNRVIGRHRWAG